VATEILVGWAPILTGVELKTGTKGVFKVFVDGDPVFDKADAGRVVLQELWHWGIAPPLVRHRTQQILLLLDADIFENVRRQRRRQHPEDDDLLVFRKIENHVRDVGRRPIGEQFAQCVEIALIDQAFDFRC